MHDAATSVAPGTAFTMQLYALDDGLHGGLTSYGIEVMLPAMLVIDGVGAAAQMAVSYTHLTLPPSQPV